MLDEKLKAIAEPRRREILRLAMDREWAAGEIAAQFNVTRPAISQHLAVLVAADLLQVRRHGTRRLYRSNPQGLEDLKAYLSDFWDAGLQALACEAEAEERRAMS